MTGFVILSLSLFAFPPSARKIKESRELRRSIRNRIDQEISERNSGTQDIAVFLYSSEYTSRYLVASSNDTLILPLQIIKDGSVYQHMLEHHLEKLCYSTNTTELEENGDLYKTLEKFGHLSENKYYLSCPLYKGKSLIGYVSMVVEREDSNILPSYLELKYLQKHIEYTIGEIL